MHQLNWFLLLAAHLQTLNKWMKEEWCRIFDEQYVEDELIARLIRNIPVSPVPYVHDSRFMVMAHAYYHEMASYM
jgi:hypothetical protein